MNLEINIKNKPLYEPGFIPAYKFIEAYLKEAAQPYAIAWKGKDGRISKFDTFIYGTPEKSELDFYYLKLITEFTYNIWGGWKLYLGGEEALSKRVETAILDALKKLGSWVMTRVIFNEDFTVEILPYEQCPENEVSQPFGRNLNGCRIGFDGGGSDRKVSSVIDGVPVYSEEVLWEAKFRPDIDYHYNEVLSAFKAAAAKMPRVDGIGVSVAGLMIGDQYYRGSITKEVPNKDMEEKGRNLFRRAADEIGNNIPVVGRNDGDIAALAGAMNLAKNKLWGVPLGTGFGSGYVDGLGNLKDWTTNMAFSKVTVNEDAHPSDMPGFIGIGESYVSQDRLIEMAEDEGIEFPEGLYPAEKLLIVQEYMNNNDPRTNRIFTHMGCCFAHMIPMADLFLDIEHIYLIGRLVSGRGGEVFVQECKRVLNEDYPKHAAKMTIWLPDENDRRVSQAVAAASLPVIE